MKNRTTQIAVAVRVAGTKQRVTFLIMIAMNMKIVYYTPNRIFPESVLKIAS
jgi:hypothetical protein